MVTRDHLLWGSTYLAGRAPLLPRWERGAKASNLIDEIVRRLKERIGIFTLKQDAAPRTMFAGMGIGATAPDAPEGYKSTVVLDEMSRTVAAGFRREPVSEDVVRAINDLVEEIDRLGGYEGFLDQVDAVAESISYMLNVMADPSKAAPLEAQLAPEFDSVIDNWRTVLENTTDRMADNPLFWSPQRVKEAWVAGAIATGAMPEALEDEILGELRGRDALPDIGGTQSEQDAIEWLEGLDEGWFAVTRNYKFNAMNIVAASGKYFIDNRLTTDPKVKSGQQIRLADETRLVAQRRNIADADAFLGPNANAVVRARLAEALGIENVTGVEEYGALTQEFRELGAEHPVQAAKGFEAQVKIISSGLAKETDRLKAEQSGVLDELATGIAAGQFLDAQINVVSEADGGLWADFQEQKTAADAETAQTKAADAAKKAADDLADALAKEDVEAVVRAGLANSLGIENVTGTGEYGALTQVFRERGAEYPIQAAMGYEAEVANITSKAIKEKDRILEERGPGPWASLKGGQLRQFLSVQFANAGGIMTSFQDRMATAEAAAEAKTAAKAEATKAAADLKAARAGARTRQTALMGTSIEDVEAMAESLGITLRPGQATEITKAIISRAASFDPDTLPLEAALGVAPGKLDFLRHQVLTTSEMNEAAVAGLEGTLAGLTGPESQGISFGPPSPPGFDSATGEPSAAEALAAADPSFNIPGSEFVGSPLGTIPLSQQNPELFRQRQELASGVFDVNEDDFLLAARGAAGDDDFIFKGLGNRASALLEEFQQGQARGRAWATRPDLTPAAPGVSTNPRFVRGERASDRPAAGLTRFKDFLSRRLPEEVKTINLGRPTGASTAPPRRGRRRLFE
jgi:hypothetical protein